MTKITIGARGSKLSIAYVEKVKELLIKKNTDLNEENIDFKAIKTSGDINQNEKLSQTVNLALNSTLSRTLNTSLTTLLVLLAIFLFGGESIRGFMFALIVGVIIGTYSSVFIATPVMFDSQKKKVIEV